MGKRQHQSDKLYLTAKEWAEVFGGKKVNTGDPSKGTAVSLLARTSFCRTTPFNIMPHARKNSGDCRLTTAH
jgi:hypothetical protein